MLYKKLSIVAKIIKTRNQKTGDLVFQNSAPVLSIFDTIT